MDEFCVNCEIKLPLNMFRKPIGFEFKNGFYCEKCARIKVKSARGVQ